LDETAIGFLVIAVLQERRTGDPSSSSGEGMENDSNERLVSVNFHLYRSCNERCRYCFASFPDIATRLATADAERLIFELASRGTRKITFVGGEPTLHPDLPRLLKATHASQMTTAMVTNGFRLRQVVEAAADAIDWVGLSVDSADEAVQASLGRGDGHYVKDSIALFDFVRARGIRTKLNTVVTKLNWEEDLSALVRRTKPERWKVFQVLRLDGQNDATVQPLLISSGEFRSFVARHEHLAAEGLAPVPEDNEAMTGSYLMIDPLGRFFDNVAGRLRFSRPILDAGIDAALTDIEFSLTRLRKRGGVYPW
jgi:radical S-adenosyl methionine domain-containing protein 2